MISQKLKSIGAAVLLFVAVVLVINQFTKDHTYNMRKQDIMLQSVANDTCYGVIFDAGSSSTKLSVYSWQCRDMVSLPQINPISVLNDKVSPGLSAFASNLTGIDGYLSPLLAKVKTVIPQEKLSTTPIMLGATAGMRLISEQNQTAILEQTNKFFNNSGLYFAGSKWNRVISGQEEGIFLWIATNYLKGSIRNNTDLNENVKTSTTIDLGGASTQIAFKPKAEIDHAFDYNVTLPENNDYTVYSISYLGFGNDQARTSVVNLSKNQTLNEIFTGCYNQGFNETNSYNAIVYGTSQPIQCVNGIRQLLNITNCPYPQVQECSINNTYQPLVPLDSDIIAVSGVNAALTSFNISSPFYPEELRLAAEEFCALDFQTIQQQDPNNPYISTKCFLGLYASTLLIDGYQVGSRLVYSPSKINGAEPAWSLGFLFNEVSNLNCDDQSSLACKNLQSIFKAFRL